MRSVTVSEPRWTEQDRAEVLAFQLWQSSFCPCGCGQKTEDTLSNEETGPGFKATRAACRARMAIIDAQDAIANEKSPYVQARLWTVNKIAR